jgi:SAM-dependent methyltransferase
MDTREYERAISDAGAEDYELTIVDQNEIYHKHFIASNWAKDFSGLFLDYGCGTGIVSRILKAEGHEVVGLDISRGVVTITKNLGVPVVVGDVLHLPFKEKTFTVVCVAGVLHHILDLKGAFGELDRCTKHAILINEPSTNIGLLIRLLRFFYPPLADSGVRDTTVQDSKYHGSKYERPLNPDYLTQILQKHGFKINKIRFYTHVPKRIGRFYINEKIRYYLIAALFSKKKGNHMEIVAVRN